MANILGNCQTKILAASFKNVGQDNISFRKWHSFCNNGRRYHLTNARMLAVEKAVIGFTSDRESIFDKGTIIFSL
ncbi:hypothetical protein ACWN8V_07405 [Vagococcus elongatus]|uniref:hypothetical protein n=1 Tax=Vagococcus elongatus TaxID=180344 RepID=UPI000F8703D0|nr:hypothetical protein [Vagococcus elongatus]